MPMTSAEKAAFLEAIKPIGTAIGVAQKGFSDLEMWLLSQPVSDPVPPPVPTPTPTPTPVPSTYPDRSADIAAVRAALKLPPYIPGVIQHPDLLKTKNVRPGWKVPGVDYYVGVPKITTLKVPTTANLPAGASWQDSTQVLIRIDANNVTIQGFDLTGRGGIGIYVAPGITGTKIIDNLYVASKSNAPIFANIGPNCDGTYIGFNTVDGGGASGNLSFGELIYNQGKSLTFEYNYVKNAPQHFVSGGSGPLNYRNNLLENGGRGSGQHLNYLQFGGGAVIDPVVRWNMLLQKETAAAGEGIQMYNNGTGTITGGEVAYNVMMADAEVLEPKPSTADPIAISYWLNLGTKGPTVTAKGTCHDNFMDSNPAYGPIYPGNVGFTYANNFDMDTGKLIAAV